MAKYYNWKIEKVMLLPFGALTVFHEKINRPLKEEFLIAISGPLFQIVCVFIYTRVNYNEFIINYSNLILIFNLLPIYPLDGSKILNVLLNKLTSFKKSHLLTVYISVLTIILIILKVKFNLILMMILLFVFIKVIDEYKNHNNIFNKFLLERYNNNFNFNKRIIIDSVYKMKRDYKHLFYNGNNYETEREILKKRFDFKRKI